MHEKILQVAKVSGEQSLTGALIVRQLKSGRGFHGDRTEILKNTTEPG